MRIRVVGCQSLFPGYERNGNKPGGFDENVPIFIDVIINWDRTRTTEDGMYPDSGHPSKCS